MQPICSATSSAVASSAPEELEMLAPYVAARAAAGSQG
jgi:hypothetical protein